jgi:hypothetical protein
MKNVKTLFLAIALLLVTVGIFAGKSRYQSVIIYGYDASTSTFYELVYACTLVDLTVTNTGIQAKITDLNGHAFPLYAGKSLTSPIYTTVAL